MSSSSFSNPATNNANSFLSERHAVVPPSEYSTMACLLNGGTGLLVSKANFYLTSLLQSSQHHGNSQVSNATMVTESVPVPNSFAVAQEVTERESLQTRLVCLILYLDELKHEIKGGVYIRRPYYIVNETNIERLRARVQFVEASIVAYEHRRPAASVDGDALTYTDEVHRFLLWSCSARVVRTANIEFSCAAMGPWPTTTATAGDIFDGKPGSSKDQTDNTIFSAGAQDNTAINPYNKPLGEPNRPNSGGYILMDKLIKDGKWTKQQYHDIKSEEKKLEICEQVGPAQIRYPDIWPVKDFLKMYLKHTSASHIRQI
ncbi:hypothetical protein EDD85DRAFT_796367 [Armillaria nabsnona]|nr:hypothetical protein EDD85DRAFT_796367 [Armillaria nabsnona]